MWETRAVAAGISQQNRNESRCTRRKQWLLIKHRDESADPSWTMGKPEEQRSALTGRTLEQIAAGRPAKKRKTRAA